MRRHGAMMIGPTLASSTWRRDWGARLPADSTKLAPGLAPAVTRGTVRSVEPRPRWPEPGSMRRPGRNPAAHCGTE
eukprot:191795-Hanusia_phi.AAC.1